MKRGATLQPYSREHHTALTLAKTCERVSILGNQEQVIETCQRAILAYENQLQPHFLLEEGSLLPLLKSLESQPIVERTLEDHRKLRELLRKLQQNDIVALGEFGKSLAEHVRFEERELFPLLETLL